MDFYAIHAFLYTTCHNITRCYTIREYPAHRD